MGKYIDADHLKVEIERRKQSLRAGICSENAFTKEQKREMLVASEEIDRFNRIIDSLQQEQDYSDLSGLERTIHRGFLCAGVENVPVAIIKETAKEVQSILKAEG